MSTRTKRGPRRRGSLLPLLGCAAFTYAALPARGAHAWGDDGHKIVCAIASRVLASHDLDEVERLVRGHRQPDGQRYTHFPQACTFADKARGNARSYDRAVRAGDTARALRLQGWARFGEFNDWHFLNVPRRTHQVDAADCRDDCVLTGIAEHRARLADSSLEGTRRAEALMLLGHWVGDIHQPLHVSYADDLGGTRIDRIEGGFYSNSDLHAVWDSGIVASARGNRDWWTYAADLAAGIDQVERQQWEQSQPIDWANESYRLTTGDGLDYCAWTTGTCRSVGPTRTLDQSYQTRFQPVVETRLRQAGVRLARLIAAALDDGS